MITPTNDGDNYFQSIISYVVLPILWTYIPILIVLLIHLKGEPLKRDIFILFKNVEFSGRGMKWGF